MKPRVYVETTVISYLTSPSSHDVIVAAYQQITRNWWRNAATRFELVASQLVLMEAAAGNREMAMKRLEVLVPLELLEIGDAARSLASHLLATGAVPRKAADDAVHIAAAVTNGAHYLVTWNFRHIANAAMRDKIDAECRAMGYQPTILCTCEELVETQ
jgi:predicted nucleic acid-binding protein